MKTLLYIAITLFAFSSCKKKEVVTVDFDYYQASNSGKVTFNNKSKNAKDFLWKFGDDSISTEKDPVHKFALNGTYQVTLAVSKTKSITKDVVVTNEYSGRCVFYTEVSSYGTIKVKMFQNQVVGKVTQAVPVSTIPICGASGCLTMILPPGTYNYDAYCIGSSKTFTGQFTVTKDGCIPVKLV